MSKRLTRIVVVGAIAIVAAVLLVPQIRDLAEGEAADGGIPEGLDVFRAAASGTEVYGIGGVLDGDSATSQVFVFGDGAWELATTPEGVGTLGDIAIRGDLVVVAGTNARGEAAVWTATLPELDWKQEEIPRATADMRGLAMTDSAVVVVGSTFDEEGDAFVLARSAAGEWERASLPGGRAVPMAVVATADGFVAGGSSDEAPAIWTSPDGRAWSAQPAGGTKGSIQMLAASGDSLMAIGSNERVLAAFAEGTGGRTPIALPSEDAGETAFAIAARDDGWIVVGFDIDVGDVAHAITWSGDKAGEHWSLTERVAADRLTDVVVIDGEPFGVGSLERGGKLTPVLLPL